ncbi:primosomal protein N' [Sphingomonas psychrotolerans]|uniref:Replication restart protein PriA n=1 Tax=Sphingomonas psychrotolerans TaxID=1327635 RepID=A0ABU3N9A6_9SPHN|nr:primosomal protein N' [Sphingomonas psychrotolerans]MDT8761095.1 primosomal protein N' [Sphingomonas psychrotolerans]
MRARILVLHPALGPLDYRVPQGMTVQPGSIVVVPIGPRQYAGVVWEPERLPVEEIGDNRLRNILAVADAPPIPEPVRRLVEWTANYYLSPLSAVLAMAVRTSAAFESAPTITEYRATGVVPERLTPQRAQALERIGERQGLVRELATIADVSEGVIRGLCKVGAIEPVTVDTDSPYPLPDPGFGPPDLSREQADVASILRQSVGAASFQPFLLDGVTGSGKTEVYFEAIAAAIAAGKQTLVLLPEIALTEPFLTRFTQRFGCEPVAWHSGLRTSQRRRAWRAIASGEALVTVGARSALFLPYPNLGLIVVDEAHETSFKQEEGVHYHARDVAVMRGKFEDCPVVLASATPAIETRHQVELGRYEELKLPGRYGLAELPDIEAIDLIKEPPDRGRWLSPRLILAIDAALERGEQSLLFLNRRGYAPLTLCRHCGHRFQCPNCTAWMVEHRLIRRLTCHHCGHTVPTPEICPECEESDSLVACGPGVERIADEVALLWPNARTAIVTSDTLWSPAKAAEFVQRMDHGDIDIVVGTQLVTKGYHFPNLTVVGVVDADLGLDGGDLRASERTFQQIMQVSGRAGRGEKPGKVFIQTHAPEAQVMQALISGNSAAFYEAETEARREAGAPPYGRYAAIIVSSEDKAAAEETARMIGRTAPKRDEMHVYGPAPAPLAMLRGRHRFRLLVHARRAFDVQDMIRDWLGALEWSAKVRVAVDVDPYSFV